MGNFTQDDFDQLMAVFREQSLQILDEMGQELLQLEGASNKDEETFARLRRGAHTIKGDSACMGLNGITEIAHKIEDLFDLVVRGEQSFDESLVYVVFRNLDAIRNSLNAEPVGDVPDQIAQDLLREFAVVEKQEKVAGQFDNAVEGIAEISEVSFKSYSQEAAAKKSSYVRIEASKIDWLLNLAGEMVIAKSILDEAEWEGGGRGSDNEFAEELVSARGHLNKLIGELQKNAMKMRMVPVGQLFKRFNRPMKELAKESGKNVQFAISGGETEIDRSMVDGLYEPILHLLRNAIDHGLECEEERVKAGKSAVCRIDLRARHDGNQVVIDVMDDGRGIDTDLLRLKALESDVVDSGELYNMSDEDVLDLLFLDGISTAHEVTKISGRGVGASTAKDCVKQLKGSISVKSKLRSGTSFTIRLPLTVGIMRALLFRVRGQLLGLPLFAINEISNSDAADVIWLNKMEFYRLREQFIPLVRPASVLDVGKGTNCNRGDSGSVAGKIFVIVVECESCRYGVVVDELIGERELVVRPITDACARNEALTGAAILGGGEIVLVLDADAVLRKTVIRERARRN